MPQTADRADAQRTRTTRKAQPGSTVRVREHVHATLQALSIEMGAPIQDVVEEAVDAFRRQRMLEQHNQAYAALKADPRRWQEELDERRGWERASADKLEDV